MRVILYIMFIGTSYLCSAQGINFQATNWEEAITIAKKENKLIFIDAYTTWCAPCKIMDEYVFPYEKVGRLHNEHYINVKMDMEKGAGPLFISRYDITSYPSYLYLTWDGTLVHKIFGYHNIEDLVSEGNKALEPYRLERALRDRYAAGDRIPAFLYHYTYYKFHKNDSSYQVLVPQYLATQSDWNTTENRQYVFDYVTDLDSDLFKHMSENKLDYAGQVGDSAFNEKFNRHLKRALANNGTELSLERRAVIYDIAYGSIADQLMTEYKLDYFMDEKDDSNYAKTAFYYYKEYAPDDEEGIARDISLIEHHLTSEEAISFVISWHEKNAHKTNTPAAWLKIARYHLTAGEFDLANDIGKKAKKLAKTRKEDQQDYKSFLKEVKTAQKSK